MRHVGILVAITVLSSCTVPVEVDPAMTPERAKAAIGAWEQYKLADSQSTGDITPQSIQVTDDDFTDFYLSNATSTSGGGTTAITRDYKLRRIAYKDIIHPLSWHWTPIGVMFVVVTAGIMGPFIYFLNAEIENVPAGVLDLTEGNVIKTNLDWHIPWIQNWIPFWMVGATDWGWPGDHDYVQAIEFMRRNALTRAGASVPGAKGSEGK